MCFEYLQRVWTVATCFEYLQRVWNICSVFWTFAAISNMFWIFATRLKHLQHVLNIRSMFETFKTCFEYLQHIWNICNMFWIFATMWQTTATTSKMNPATPNGDKGLILWENPKHRNVLTKFGYPTVTSGKINGQCNLESFLFLNKCFSCESERKWWFGSAVADELAQDIVFELCWLCLADLAAFVYHRLEQWCHRHWSGLWENHGAV